MNINLKKSWGRIDYLHLHKGFGFVKDKSGQTLWFHHSALKPGSAQPIIGRRAIYSLSENRTGQIAINMFVLTGEEKNLSEILQLELGEDATEILKTAVTDTNGGELGDVAKKTQTGQQAAGKEPTVPGGKQ